MLGAQAVPGARCQVSAASFRTAPPDEPVPATGREEWRGKPALTLAQ